MADRIEELRGEAERELTELLNRVTSRQRARILAAIRQYGFVTSVPDDFWTQLQHEIDLHAAEVLVVLLADVYAYQYAELAKKDVPVIAKARAAAVEPGSRLGQTVASDWVNGVQVRLASSVDAKASILAAASGAAIVAYMSGAVLDATAETAAESVAITNVTRAITIAQLAAGSDFTGGDDEEATVAYTWQTEDDERVCPICEALDGSDEEEWSAEYPFGPPAHPRCRCRLSVVPLVTSADIKTTPGRGRIL